MKSKTLIPVAMLALTCSVAVAAVTDLRPRPGGMQPDGITLPTASGPTDFDPLHWGKWWGDLGSVDMVFDTTRSSSNNIAGSIKVTYDCFGGVQWNPADPKSANLAFGNFFDSKWGNNGWLGAGNEFDASKYQSLDMDVWVDTTVSSNTVIPVRLYDYNYGNVGLGNIPINVSGWQHLSFPIQSSINMPRLTAYGVYDWYNTTATTPPAHVEYWFCNVRLVARQAPPPPPTLSTVKIPGSGLLFDTGAGGNGEYGSISTASDVRWISAASAASPVTYSMTVGYVPDPALYPNYEANIWIGSQPGVGNPPWNSPDVGWLQIHSQSDGTAFAQMLWKTNAPFNNSMFWTSGLLGQFTTPTMVGTWSISFTSDTEMIVRGPGNFSTNFTLPSDWIASYNSLGGAAYAYFSAHPNGNANLGQCLLLDKVSVSGGAYQLAMTNEFTSATLDTTAWTLLGNQTFIVPAEPAWWVKWTLPAVNYSLYSTPSLTAPIQWTLLSGNTNLAAPVPVYTSGTNSKAIFHAATLGGSDRSFFMLKKQVVAKLQVLMPGETNAPGTATGKVGTPEPQIVGNMVPVTVNAVDANWEIVPYCTDTVRLTSSDTAATDQNGNPLPLTAALVGGTQTFNVVFLTSGSQTITATDNTDANVVPNTGSPTPIQ